MRRDRDNLNREYKRSNVTGDGALQKKVEELQKQKDQTIKRNTFLTLKNHKLEANQNG